MEKKIEQHGETLKAISYNFYSLQSLRIKIFDDSVKINDNNSCNFQNYGRFLRASSVKLLANHVSVNDRLKLINFRKSAGQLHELWIKLICQ